MTEPLLWTLISTCPMLACYAYRDFAAWWCVVHRIVEQVVQYPLDFVRRDVQDSNPRFDLTCDRDLLLRRPRADAAHCGDEVGYRRGLARQLEMPRVNLTDLEQIVDQMPQMLDFALNLMPVTPHRLGIVDDPVEHCLVHR